MAKLSMFSMLSSNLIVFNYQTNFNIQFLKFQGRIEYDMGKLQSGKLKVSTFGTQFLGQLSFELPFTES